MHYLRKTATALYKGLLQRECVSVWKNLSRDYSQTSVSSWKPLWKEQSFKKYKNLLNCYKKLSKANLTTFVVLSAGTGYVLGSQEKIDLGKLCWTMAGTFGASACANTLNQIYEISNDKLMTRTRLRPLPLGLTTPRHALAFALVTGTLGITALSLKTNAVAAGLAALNIVLYSSVYTPLKQLTPLNTWIGAIVGAVPPLLGWAAASGELSPGSLILAAGLYFWQIPHFLALAHLHKEDYAAAGFKMLSKTDSNGYRTARCAFRNIAYMAPLGVFSFLTGVTNGYFAFECFFLTSLFALNASGFRQRPSKLLARRTFRTSLLFLPIFMALMVFHRKPNEKEITWENLPCKITDWLSNFFSNKRSADREEFLFDSVSENIVMEDSTRRRGEGRRSFLNSFEIGPFPFAPLPFVRVEKSYWWEGLDEIIIECQESRKKSQEFDKVGNLKNKII